MVEHPKFMSTQPSSQTIMNTLYEETTILISTCVPNRIPHGHDGAAAVVPPRRDVGRVPGRPEPDHLRVDPGRQFNRKMC